MADEAAFNIAARKGASARAGSSSITPPTTRTTAYPSTGKYGDESVPMMTSFSPSSAL
jgi:hypothetical protein